ncbi:hypothetical protein QBC32DRAFT_82106 [Pseudoneurospora amorphoporcata]|uniref:Uncharacterized protein n=1 Tax=Pseudoneurospora amorphoporcata TaxID=241081 RepID=A0AAN6P0Q9_9PEZI|nr:hypothetical protein QBC32DRAFT_82106 [Pseudoneurospora amorphoporcata]
MARLYQISSSHDLGTGAISRYSRMKSYKKVRWYLLSSIWGRRSCLVVETPRGITYKTPEPDDMRTRSRKCPSTDRSNERTHMGAEEPQAMAQSSQSIHRDHIRREYYQAPDRPGSASSTSHVDWSQSQDVLFTSVASPAPSAYSNTTICAQTATIAAYTSSEHGQFDTTFSPQSTAISDPGEYQVYPRLRQGSVSSMPPLDYNPSRVGLFTNTVPSPALSTCTLNTTIGCVNSSVAAYAPSVQRPTYAMDSFPHSSGAHTAGFNHLSASARPGSSSYSNCQGNRVGPSSSAFNSCARPALSLNTRFGLDASSAYPLKNTTTATVPLSTPWNGHGQFPANASISPAQQLTGSGPYPAYGQGEAHLFGPGHYNYTGDYGRYDGMPTNNVNSTYSPALQSYLSMTEQYPSYNSNNTYTTGYQGGNGVDGSVGFTARFTAIPPGFFSITPVDKFSTIAVPSPTARAREALAAMGSMASAPYSEQEPEESSG